MGERSLQIYGKGELFVKLSRHDSGPICSHSVGLEMVPGGPGNSAGSRVVAAAGRSGEGEGAGEISTGWVAQSTPPLATRNPRLVFFCLLTPLHCQTLFFGLLANFGYLVSYGPLCSQGQDRGGGGGGGGRGGGGGGNDQGSHLQRGLTPSHQKSCYGAGEFIKPCYYDLISYSCSANSNV